MGTIYILPPKTFSVKPLQVNVSDGKFPEIFTDGNFPETFLQCSRIDFYLLIFYRNIYVSGNFDRIIYAFYSIIYVLRNSGNFHHYSQCGPPNLRTVVAPLTKDAYPKYAS
jgi:hypothetical protein